ncbi:hypothetical protein [Bradyrhizobium sp.]|uniref:hypothetical protein n=1 Tax=Bradyrhizobium sp. TaxID=376 RepID=UPI003C56ACFC
MGEASILDGSKALAEAMVVRPDCMIVNGEDVFYAEDIGDNWPELQMKDEDPDRMVHLRLSAAPEPSNT